MRDFLMVLGSKPNQTRGGWPRIAWQAARNGAPPMLVASASGLTPRMPRETGQAPGG
jgi:hypothetical protein